MQPDVGEGFAADPARLLEAAGAVQARGADLLDAAAAVRGSVSAAVASCGGPRTSAALRRFEDDLTARSEACAAALHDAGAALARTAVELAAADHLPAAPVPGGSFRETLG